jgi:hypothetical protein
VRTTYSRGGNGKEFMVTSAYWPYDMDEPPPTKEIRDVVDHCNRRGRQLIIRCDANVHYILWGIIDINLRGERPSRIFGKLTPQCS